MGSSVVVMVAIMVVVMIVPITFGVPAMPVFVPPAVVVFPAVGASFSEFMPPTFRLRTLPTVVLDGFVKFVVCLGGALLTVVGTHHRGAGEENHYCKH